jgi:hypothetical protein
MLVRILSTCRADGRHLPAGQVVDISEESARALISINRAEAEDGSLTVEDVATAVTATDEDLAKPTNSKPSARRGRQPVNPINTEED